MVSTTPLPPLRQPGAYVGGDTCKFFNIRY